jgi:hypothetical protein
MLMPAFFLILLVGWVLDNIFIDEVDVNADRHKSAESHRLVVPPRKASGGNA